MKAKPPLAFTAFTEGPLRVRFTVGQRALYRVAFDGVDPAALTGAEREAARRLFGDVDEVPARARDVVVIVKGARVGGTRFGSCTWR